MNYLIEYNTKIIGVYNTYNDAELFILGNMQNNLFDNDVKILTYKSNSCYCCEVKNFKIDNLDTVDNEININEIMEKKANLTHEINLINLQKKKIEEKKNIY